MTTEDNAGVPLLVPPEVTQQLERDECPTCQGVGSSWSDHVGNCPDCGGHGKRLAPRQVVALPEPLTCPNCDNGIVYGYHGREGVGDPVTENRCRDCNGWGVVPLLDGIYQLMTDVPDHQASTASGSPAVRRRPLGSPVRVTHRAWRDVVATRRPDKPSPYISGSGYIVLPYAIYDRLTARPHDGGVLLVEAP